MHRATVIVSVLIIGLAGPALATPANPGTQCVETAENAEAFRLANAIVETIIPADQADMIVRQLMGSIVQQMNSAFAPDISDSGLQDILDRYMKRLPDLFAPVVKKHLPDQKHAIACAYTHEFSVVELREINAFAATPAGKHYLARSSAVMSDPAVAKANQAYFTDAKVVIDAASADLKAEVEDYIAKKDKK